MANDTLPDLSGDVVLTGDQIAAFCDRIVASDVPQRFDVTRLRTATKIVRYGTLGQREWRVTLEGNRGVVVMPIAGID